MSVKRRIERLEVGSTGKHDLGIIEAKPSETLEQAVARVAKEHSLSLEQVGFAWVVWPDDRSETHQTVDDPSTLIGWVSHEQALPELD